MVLFPLLLAERLDGAVKAVDSLPDGFVEDV